MLPNFWRVGFVPPKVFLIMLAQRLRDGIDLLVRADPRVVCYASNAPPSAIADKAPTPQPLCEIDLSKFDYQNRRRESNGGNRWWRTRQSLVFTQENVLATIFEVNIENSGPSVRDKTLPTDPYHMAALFLDAGRGELIKKADWPVNSFDRTWFFPTQS